MGEDVTRPLILAALLALGLTSVVRADEESVDQELVNACRSDPAGSCVWMEGTLDRLPSASNDTCIRISPASGKVVKRWAATGRLHIFWNENILNSGVMSSCGSEP